MLRPSPGGSEAASTLFRDRILLLLVNGMSAEAAEGYCLQQGMDLETAKRLVGEARQRITVAADYTREEQLGLAVRRLEDLYSKSIAAKDTRTALQAQGEINRLLGLYAPKSPAAEEPAGEGNDAARRLALIDQYLRPLELTDDRYPTEEHARVAAAMGDPGCLSLFGDRPDLHTLFAEHVTAEYRVTTEARGHTVGTGFRAS